MVLLVVLFALSKVSAQKESNVKLKIETGFLGDWYEEGVVFLSGIFLHLEPKLKTSKKTILGLRIGTAINSQAIVDVDPRLYYIDRNYTFGNLAFSLLPTFDYYFSKNKRGPYVGLGLGYYFLTTPKDVFVTAQPLDALKLSINNQIGFLLRGGLDLSKFKVGRLDLGKFILGLEFNYVPRAAIKIPNEELVGTINYSNFALSIGYMIAKGKVQSN